MAPSPRPVTPNVERRARPVDTDLGFTGAFFACRLDETILSFGTIAVAAFMCSATYRSRN
jgi:hypothetical protein